MEWRREFNIISHRPVTSSDLKPERSFFHGSVSTFLQLVVAWIYFKISGLYSYPSLVYTPQDKTLFGNILSRSSSS